MHTASTRLIAGERVGRVADAFRLSGRERLDRDVEAELDELGGGQRVAPTAERSPKSSSTRGAGRAMDSRDAGVWDQAAAAFDPPGGLVDDMLATWARHATVDPGRFRRWQREAPPVSLAEAQTGWPSCGRAGCGSRRRDEGHHADRLVVVAFAASGAPSRLLLGATASRL